MQIFRFIVERAFSRADITINGHRPWDIHIHSDRFYPNVLFNGSLGLGESFMQEQWSTDDLEELFYRLVSTNLVRVSNRLPLHTLKQFVDRRINQQTHAKALRNSEHHYNIGNDLFFSFLGKYKNYSCGYYADASSLDEAQEAKMLRVCELLDLNQTDRLLDVGGGWGEFARFAATRFGCNVTSINISGEQIRHAKEYCRGTPVEIRKQDYRDVRDRFNKIAVLAMFTHVGHKNYQSFMDIMRRCLEPGGKMIMETVGGPVSKSNCEPWTNKYIFPGGMIPSLQQIDVAIEGLFVRDLISEFGSDYVFTLREWHRNLVHAWPSLNGKYSDDTGRMFEYFFHSVAGAFRAKELLHWHIVFLPTSRGGA